MNDDPRIAVLEAENARLEAENARLEVGISKAVHVVEVALAAPSARLVAELRDGDELARDRVEPAIIGSLFLTWSWLYLVERLSASEFRDTWGHVLDPMRTMVSFSPLVIAAEMERRGVAVPRGFKTWGIAVHASLDLAASDEDELREMVRGVIADAVSRRMARRRK